MEGGGETIVGTEQIECGDRRDHLHVGGGTQALVQSVGVECAVVGEIIDTDSHLRPIEEGSFSRVSRRLTMVRAKRSADRCAVV